MCLCFFFQAEDGIRDWSVTGVQTCALPIYELVDAGSVLPAQSLDGLLERLRKSQGIGLNFTHGLILRIASRGSRIFTPNCAGTVPKSRTLNVTKALAPPLMAASNTISSHGSRS